MNTKKQQKLQVTITECTNTFKKKFLQESNYLFFLTSKFQLCLFYYNALQYWLCW